MSHSVPDAKKTKGQGGASLSETGPRPGETACELSLQAFRIAVEILTAGPTPTTGCSDQLGDFIWLSFNVGKTACRPQAQKTDVVLRKACNSLIKHASEFCALGHSGHGRSAGSAALSTRLGAAIASTLLNLAPSLSPTELPAVRAKVVDLCRGSLMPSPAIGEIIARLFILVHGGTSARGDLACLRTLSVAVYGAVGPCTREGEEVAGGEEPDEVKAREDGGGGFKLIANGYGSGSTASVTEPDDDEPDGLEDGTKLKKKRSRSPMGGRRPLRPMAAVGTDVTACALESTLLDVEYCLASLRKLAKNPRKSNSSSPKSAGGTSKKGAAVLIDEDDDDEAKDGGQPGVSSSCKAAVAEVDRLCGRMVAVASALGPLLKAKLPAGKHQEKLVLVTRRHYDGVIKVNGQSLIIYYCTVHLTLS